MRAQDVGRERNERGSPQQQEVEKDCGPVDSGYQPKERVMVLPMERYGRRVTGRQ